MGGTEKRRKRRQGEKEKGRGKEGESVDVYPWRVRTDWGNDSVCKVLATDPQKLGKVSLSNSSTPTVRWKVETEKSAVSRSASLVYKTGSNRPTPKTFL